MSALAVVMYRNPAEEFLWTYVYPWVAGIACVLFALFLIWCAFAWVVDKFNAWRKHK